MSQQDGRLRITLGDAIVARADESITVDVTS